MTALENRQPTFEERAQARLQLKNKPQTSGTFEERAANRLRMRAQEQQQSPEPIQQPRQSKPILDYFTGEEKTPEQLKAMSVREQMEYAEELNREREYRQSTGLMKGALSGLTFSASEHIPGLKPDENDLMVGLGKTVGSYLPISKLYGFIGQPLVNFAAKSPVAREGLMALARMTGFGATGATYKAGSDIVQGEIPSPSELAKEGATWAAIDAALQALGVGVAFSRAVNNIAESEGITAKEVLAKLWDATKRRLKRPIHPDEIAEPEVEALMEEASNAEKEIEIARKEPEKPGLEYEERKPIGYEERQLIEHKPQEVVAELKVKTDQQIESELAEAKDKLGQYENLNGKQATKERSALIQQVNELELERHNRSKEAKPKENLPTFETSKGSTYQVHEDGSTTRIKAARVEHPGEEGLQPKSEKTWYVTPEDSVKLGEFQTTGADKKIVELPNGQLGVQYLTGKDAGKIEKRTLVDFSKEPAEGLIPVESWDDGVKIHFGNPIIKIENTKAAKPEKPAKPVKEKEPEIIRLQKEIIALSKQRDQIKGNTNEGRRQRNLIQDKIDPLELRFEKLKDQQIKSFEKEIPEQQINTSERKAKEQKDYFIEALEDALENPTNKEQVLIKVPGDGVYRVNNVPEVLEGLLKKVKKEWPVKTINAKPPTLGVKKPSEKQTAEEEVLSSKTEKFFHAKTQPRQPVFGKKQAVARSKVIELFRTAFNDPIRLGKFRQKAQGIHKMWPKVTRLLKDNDVEVAAHEIGHNLHTVLYGGDATSPGQQRKNVIRALTPYLGELKPLGGYEPFELEGFAEFTRLYVTNPNVAQELAPNFYAKFENDLRAEYPEMLNALLEARDYYDQYLQGTPESRIRAQTSYGDDKGKLANIIDSVKKYLDPDFLKTQFLDDVFPAKRLVAEAFGIPLSEVENLKDERNLYRALRVLKGAVGKADVFVLHETFQARTLDKINGSLRDILKQLPDEEAYREFNDYLIARRSIEKAGQNVETGINLGDAVAVEQQLRPKYGTLAKELDKYNDSLLKYARDSGLLSNEQYQMIKKNNLMYVPFQRELKPEKGGVAAGSGRLQAGKPIKRMRGSTRNIIAPIESVLKNTYSIIINAEKNIAGQTLAKIAKMKGVGAYVEHVPTPIKLKGRVEGEQVARELAKRFEREGLDDLIEYDEDGKPILREDIADAIPDVFLRFGPGQYPAGENIVTIYFGGKPKYFEVSPEIFEMWTKGMTPYTAGLLTKILRIPARSLRAGAILNPKFIQKNIIRDTWGSWLFTKYGKSVKDPAGLFIDTLYSPLSMLATSARKGPLYIEWLKSGGGMSTMQSLDRDAVVKKLEEVRKGYKPHQVIKWLRQVAEISEEANRLAEFGRALEVEGRTRLGREIAAFAARDLSIDFAKMGLQVKALNQIIPFFNATVQGGDKLLRTLNNPEDRKNFIPRIIGFIVLPSLMLAWLNKDDSRVQEFHEEEKDFNFITFVGDRAIKIPVPFETGVMVHGMTQRMFNYFMKKDPAAFEEFMGSVASAMLPNFIPTIGNPFIETWANKNFFTGARIVPMGKEDLISKYQYKTGTSSTARVIGRAMTYMLGQETRSKAASPAVIDHFITSWGGGLGRLVVSVSDAALESAGLSDKIPGPQQAITDRLGLDAFTARYPRANTRSIEKFYDNYADATSKRKSIKHAEKMGLETEEDLGAAGERFEKIHNYAALQNAYRAIQNSQRAINNIWNDPSIEPDLKKQMIDDLYLQQIEFAKAVNEDIKRYRLTTKEVTP